MTLVSVCQAQSKLHSVHPRLFLQGGLSLQPNFKKGGLTEPHLLEGIAWKEGGDFLQVCVCGGGGGGGGGTIVT